MYAKLFTSIYQGTLRGNSHGLLVFTNLLAHCDKEGVADIHPRAIAEEVGLSQDQVRAALEVLESPDDESRSPEEHGRRIIRIDEHRAWGWLVVNYAKYRAIRSEEDRREQNREAQARWREKNKQSKPASATGETDKPIQRQRQKQEEESQKKEARKRAAPLARSSDIDGAVWDDWLALRKAKRAPVSPTVVAEAQREACKAGLTLEAFLRVWCIRGSQGLQAGWLTSDERKATAPPAEPAWRTEQRTRNEAFLGPAAASRKQQPQRFEVIDADAKALG